ncbi:efflux RND transporter permease subunit [Fodinicurvata fenggangensis]|uniref:efflux RND transporter permease subunit n=1 Tax=Fodinicurvata fenggangensis TaxID=1121830 RepID=UPI00047E95E4|nr:efflux RND transporter permease subunit [Fodinicurvata fenggangensis]
MFEGIVRRGTLMTVILLILCVIGVVAALRIPVQMIPDLEVRTITVRTNWPAATPQDVEKDIVIEQEEYLSSIPGLERMVSTVSSGRAEVELEFPYDIDITETLIRVNNALSQVPSYPQNVDQPRVFATSFSDNAFMYFRVAPLPGNPRGLDMNMMGDFIDDNVRNRLERVAGVSQAEFRGGERQVQILVEPDRLAGRDLSLIDLRDAITSRNRDVSGGELESGKRRYLLRTVGRYADIEALEATILDRRGDSILRLSDVAKIRLGHFEPGEVNLVDGEAVLGLSIRREAGSNVIEIKRAVMEELEAINADVLEPAGMRLSLTNDDVRYVEDSVTNVWINLILGACLATLVMYAFLRSFRSTLVGVIGIPVCTIAAFLGLLLAGRTINVISLAGVAFAIGMTLDNSIVVLESIDMARRRGLDRFRAAVEGVREVWPAVVASTLTTVLVFTPIVFITEEAGQLYSDVAIAISASILTSMLVAITIIPTLGARILTVGADTGKRPEAESSGLSGRQHNFVLRSVEWIIARPLRRAVCMIVTLAVSGFIIFALTPPAEYLPEGEEAKTFATMNAPPGYNLSTMTGIARELEERLRPYQNAEPGDYEAGRIPVPALGQFSISAQPQSVRIIATTKDPGQIEALMDELSRIYEAYPGMRSFVSRGSIITSNEGGTRSVNLDISGPELQGIYQVAEAAYRQAEQVFENPRIQTNPATLSLSQPMIQVHPDWDRASEMGFDAEQLGFSVAALNDGAFVDEFFSQDDKIDIYLYSQTGQDATPDRLGQLPLYTPQGTTIPLSSIARIEETVDTSSIRRVNGNRTVTLNIIPPRSVPLEAGVALVEQEVVGQLRAAGEIPGSISLDISGAADQLEATQDALIENYAVAVVIVYLLLVAIFTHWGYPLLIMTTIPLGIAGGIVGLALMNLVGGMLPAIGLSEISQPFDMISMLGFLILMGTVVNNPILLVHRAMENMRKAGSKPQEAVSEAVASRLRPIAMSSITTIFGLAPLVFAPGSGSELYRGVGAIVLFGIMGAAVVSLTFLPALTVFVLNWSHRKTT